MVSKLCSSVACGALLLSEVPKDVCQNVCNLCASSQTPQAVLLEILALLPAEVDNVLISSNKRLEPTKNAHTHTHEHKTHTLTTYKLQRWNSAHDSFQAKSTPVHSTKHVLFGAWEQPRGIALYLRHEPPQKREEERERERRQKEERRTRKNRKLIPSPKSYDSLFRGIKAYSLNVVVS